MQAGHADAPASTSVQGSLHPCTLQRSLQPCRVMRRCAVRCTCLMLHGFSAFPGTKISRKRESSSDEPAESISVKKAKNCHPPSSSIAIPSQLGHGRRDTKEEEAPRNREFPTSQPPLDGERLFTTTPIASTTSAASTTSTASAASTAASCSETTTSALSPGSASGMDFVPEEECRYEEQHAGLDLEIQRSISSIMTAFGEASDEADGDDI